MAAITLEDVNQNLVQQNDILNKVQDASTRMSQSIEALVDTLKDGFAGDDLEEDREQRPKVIPQTRAAPGLGGGGTFDFVAFGAGLLSGLLKSIPIIIAALSGAVIASFNEFANDLARTLAAQFLGLGKLIARAFTFTRIPKLVAAISRGIQSLFAPGGIFSLIGKIVNPLVRLFNGATGKLLSSVAKGIGILGTVLRTIFLPIGLLVTAYDTIKGAVKGYEDGTVMGALSGAVGGFIGSIVGAPANLLNQFVQFLDNKLKFISPETRKRLEELDFEKVILDFFLDLPDKINKLFEKALNVDIGIPDFDFPNPFEGIRQKIGSMDFSSMNLGEAFGMNFNFGDKLKGVLLDLFGGNSFDPGFDDDDTGVAIASSPAPTAITLREEGQIQREGRRGQGGDAPAATIIDQSVRSNNTSTHPLYVGGQKGMDTGDLVARDNTYAGVGYAGIRG
tara:strand:- start:877 stop:2226 length:1350 start_codon:yes stop_codon:yes gene_type:complete